MLQFILFAYNNVEWVRVLYDVVQSAEPVLTLPPDGSTLRPSRDQPVVLAMTADSIPDLPILSYFLGPRSGAVVYDAARSHIEG